MIRFRQTPEQVVARAYAKAINDLVKAATSGPATTADEAKHKRAAAFEVLKWISTQNYRTLVGHLYGVEPEPRGLTDHDR